MLRTALRNVLAHKARLIMTALAVMLGVAFVSGTLVFGDSVAQALSNASTKNLKDVAVSVQAEHDIGVEQDDADDRRTTALNSELADEIRELPGVASVHPAVNGNATMAAKDGKPLNAESSWQNLATNYAPDAAGDGEDSRFPLAEGRGPAASDEIALDSRTADDGDYQIGDTVRFATDGPALTKKLVGIVDTDDPRVTAGGTLALFDTSTAQELFLRPDQFDELVVGSEPGVNDQELTDQVSALLPAEGASAASGAQLADEQGKRIAENTKNLTQMLMVFAGIALFVGVFIIANTFTMLIAQRSREIALMRAVGASRRQVVRAILIEAGLLGLGASAIGFTVGLGIAAGLRPVLNASGAGLPEGPLVISTDAIVWSLVVGVAVTVLAAWLPSRKAAKIAPIEALNSVDLAPPARGMAFRNALGGLLTGAGVLVMLFVSKLDGRSDSDVMIAMFGAALIMTGVIVLAPLLSRPVVSLAGMATTRLFGVSGKLAKENALRNPRRTAATASALMIGLSLITALSVAAISANEALKKDAVQGLSADYKVSNADFQGVEPEFNAKIAEVPGVSRTAPVVSTTMDIQGEFTVFTGVAPKQFGKVVDLKFSSGALTDIGPGKVAISDEQAERTGLAKGDTFDGTLDGPRDTVEKKMTVVGIYEESRHVDDALSVLDEVLPYTLEGTLDSILVKAESGEAGGALEQDIRDAVGNSPLMKVQNQEQLTKEQAGEVDVMLNMVYGLLGMAILIAVLGVVNTLAMSVFERTREIGLLRAIGFGREGIKQMVRLESVVISLFGAALGIGTGIFVAWSASSMVGSSLTTYETILPWARIAMFVLLAVGVGVLAAIWPARRAARLNMLGAINAQ